MPDYYQTLGVPPTASTEQIKAAYREYAKHFHPDLHQNSDFFKKRFQEVQQSYDILSDQTSRSHFDRQFNNKFTNSSSEFLAWAEIVQGLKTEVTNLKNQIEFTQSELEQKQREWETGKKHNDILKITLAAVRQERDELKSQVEATKKPASVEENNKVNDINEKAKTFKHYISVTLGSLLLISVIIFTGYYTYESPKMNLAKRYAHITNYKKWEYDSDNEYQEQLIWKADSVLHSVSIIDTSFNASTYNGKHIELASFLTLRGHAKMKIGNDSGAIRDISLSIDKAKVPSAYPYFLRAFIKHKQSDSEGALLDLDNAITIDPTYVQGLKLRAEYYYGNKLFDKALLDLQKIVSVDSQNAEAYAHMGLCYTWIGNSDMACQSYRRASELGYSKAFDYIKQNCH
jgi:tetratricopeptide (TPR) repeat protein